MKWLIVDVRLWWRMWSVRVNAIGLLILSALWFDPTLVLAVVNMMPPAVRSALPDHIELFIGGLFFALAMISRLVRQPKLDTKRQEGGDGAV
jgi:hypothetical protein